MSGSEGRGCPLGGKSCKPCEGGMPALGEAEAEALNAQLPAPWEIEEGRRIVKRFKFPDFVTALAFVNRAGEIAESEGHHPEIRLGWGKVRVTLWTHAVEGLSENDFILAAKIEEIERPEGGG